MGTLTTKQRNRIPHGDFAIPSKREYPINDAAHARDALARVSANGTSAEKAEVRSAVHKKFPMMDMSGMAKGKSK
jgi:hypothetical protein